MMDQYGRPWKIGELAKMFDINVQLLRHYDKEGLLVPEIRNPENNWRSYDYDQIYSLGMIRLLRDLNCPLDDIGEFMRTRSLDSSREFLRQQMDSAMERYEKFRYMEELLTERFAVIDREIEYVRADQVFVCSEDEIRYVEIGGLKDDFANELFYLYPTLVFYEGRRKRFAAIIPENRVDDYNRYCNHQGGKLNVIPPDDYLVGFHWGSYDGIYDTFDRMRHSADEVLEEGERLDDTNICIDIINQFIEADKNRFITKVMIRILRS